MSFFEELKRRNVFRVGIAYAVASWVLLQVVDLVLDNSDAPGWVMDVFMMVVVLGFVVSLIIAWAYEVTPDGIKRESEVDREESITRHTANKLNYITLGAVAVMVLLLLADRFFPGDTSSQPAMPVETAAVEKATDETAASKPEPTLQRGIAVLPFSNLSEDPNNAFFAGGVHEDVLTHLSRIADLRVISRTSMMNIAKRGMDIREMGEYLSISHVLEGSVRRAGDQVRVTVQLIDATNDVHLWAENYDRKLDDIFAIQSEIAQKIAGQLEMEMSPEQVERMAEAPTKNLEAYDLYQKARESARVWLDAEGFKQQLPLFEKVVALDPEFLAAQVDLVAIYGRLVWTGSDPEGIYREKAKQLADHIVKKWPGRPETDNALANYYYTVERDYEKALAFYLKVLPHQPGDAKLLLNISSSYKRLGQHDLGLEMARRALSLDPQHPSINGEVGFHLIGLMMFEEAMEQFEQSLIQFPDDLSSRANVATYSLQLRGDTDRYYEQMALIHNVDPRSFSVDQRFFRMQLAQVNVDQLIAELDSRRDPDISWKNAAIDSQIAELLNLADRKEDSISRAKNALNAVEALLSAGEPLPSNKPKVEYAKFANMACLASDRGAFNQYQSVFNALKAVELGMESLSKKHMAIALAECGDIDAGWKLLESAISVILGLSEWEIVVDPIYAHYFSGVPEFQALVEKKNTEKASGY
jgi:TolB-like protein